GQQLARFDFTAAHQLWDAHDRAASARALFEIDDSQRAVRGAQIDTHRVFRVTHTLHNSTSAGARILKSWPASVSGKRISRARQRLCLKIPRSGAPPATLPTSLIASASKPSLTVVGSPSASSRTGSTSR